MKRKVYIYSLILVIIDFLIKILIKSNLKLYQSIIIIPSFFRITYVENSGAAFSILQGKQIYLIILGIIMIFGIFYYLRKENLNKLKVVYYSLLIGGIIGNIIDRIIYHNVIDYFDFNIFSYEAPIFNLADTFIFFGVVFILIEGGIKGGNRSIRK